jgi:glycolate oxidase
MFDPQLRREIAAIVGGRWFLDSPHDLVAYSYDATPLYQAMPDGVAMPDSAEQVAGILRLCQERRVPVVPRGGGSNLSAGTVPVAGGLVLVLTRMNRIREIDSANLTATVEPGVVTADLHAAVEALGLFYPPDPGSMRVSTIGGNVAEGAGGLRGLKYGTTRDYVIGLEAVLPGGERIRTGGKLMKDVAGYDLTRLLVGSEGTLAVITEITVKLLPLPESKRTALALFADLEGAARSVERIIAARIIPATLEFLDNPTARVVEEYARVGLPTDAGAVLLMEQDGPPAVAARDIEAIAAICREEGATQVSVARTEEEGAALLTARRSALAALSRLRPTTILEDVTVPRSQIAAMVRAVAAIAARHGVMICTFGHAGDGNLHPTCLTDARDADEIHRVEQAFDEIFVRAVELGGTITGEHGVGMVKAPYLEWKAGAAGIEVMQGIKRAFDPHSILNPGKIFPGEGRKRVVVQHG